MAVAVGAEGCPSARRGGGVAVGVSKIRPPNHPPTVSHKTESRWRGGGTGSGRSLGAADGATCHVSVRAAAG